MEAKTIKIILIRGNRFKLLPEIFSKYVKCSALVIILNVLNFSSLLRIDGAGQS